MPKSQTRLCLLLACLAPSCAPPGEPLPGYFADETACPDLQSHVPVSLPPQALTTADARAQLAALPRWQELQAEIVWVASDGQRLPFSGWTTERQDRLFELFGKIAAQVDDLGLQCPDPENIWTVGQYKDPLSGLVVRPSSWPWDVFVTEAQAFDVFAAHVAHALFLEAFRRVPWSVLDFPATERVELFDSSRFFTGIPPNVNDYRYPAQIRPNRDFWNASSRQGAAYEAVCDPRIGYDFIRGLTASTGIDLLGPSPRATLVNLTAWAQVNLGHGGTEDFPDLAAAQRHLFLGERLIQRTWVQPRAPKMVMAQYGCHSASNLLHDLARSVNIPLLHVATDAPWTPPVNIDNVRHSGLVYDWTGPDFRALPHTDDIYANNVGPIFPIDAAGQPLSACARRRVFFEQTWAPPDMLRSWGFVFAENLLPVTASSPYANASWSYPRQADMADDGIMLGYWPPDPSGTSKEYVGYTLEQMYQTCSWSLVQEACHSAASFRVWIETNIILPLPFAGPVVRSSADFYQRLRTCVAAYGGCQAAGGVNAQWTAQRGKHFGLPRSH